MSVTLEEFKNIFHEYIKRTLTADLETLVADDLADQFPGLDESHKPNLKMLADVLHEAALVVAGKLPELLKPRVEEATALNKQLPPTDQGDVAELSDAGWLAKTAYNVVAGMQTEWLSQTPLGTFQEVILERPDKTLEWCEQFKAYAADNDAFTLMAAGQWVDRDLLEPLRQKVKQLPVSGGEATVMPSGRQKLRDARGRGAIAGELAGAPVKKEVLAWVTGIKSGASSEECADLMDLFTSQAIKDASILEAVMKCTPLTREQIMVMPAYLALPAFRAKKLLDQYRPDEEEERAKQKQADKAEGEQFLSSGYRIINPLLAAFDALHVDPSVHRAGDYDYTPIKDKLLENWKRIAVERKYSDEGSAELWDEVLMADTYRKIRAIQRAWDDYEMPVIDGGTVVRGDTVAMYSAYPVMDPRKNAYPDGVVKVSGSITWPGIMSTTVGEPKSHGFVQAKTVIWRFSVDPKHAGRSIGSINPSEQEVTFPLGVSVVLDHLIVRVNDKTIEQGEFGAVAEVIAFAKLV